MKAYRGSKVWLHSFLTLVLYGSEPTGIPPQKIILSSFLIRREKLYYINIKKVYL